MHENQQLFRVTAQVAAEGVFNSLDRNLQPEVLLISVLANSTDADLPEMIAEPERLLISPDSFKKIWKKAQKLKLTEEEQLSYLSFSTDQQIQESLILRHKFKLVIEELIRKGQGSKRSKKVVYCSWPSHVGAYMVFVLLQFDKIAYDKHFRVSERLIFRKEQAAVSFIDATATEFLSECTKALHDTQTIGSLHLLSRDYNEILRAAGKRLMHTPASGTHGLFDACNAISSLTYEGYEGQGTIIIADRHNPGISMSMVLENPIPIRDYRSIRKLLELSGKKCSLITDASKVFGLGLMNRAGVPTDNDIFSIKFLKYYQWELWHQGNILMNVNYGLPGLPKTVIDKSYFTRVIEKIFPYISQNAVKTLWSLTTTATKQLSGTILVISEGAAAEAERLANQSFKILPVQMNNTLVKQFSNIDGAILIDTDAVCHAIGIILDGLASEHGDPSRGSRYNSAVRYVDTSTHACLVVVVSEDGMIDLIPNLQS